MGLLEHPGMIVTLSLYRYQSFAAKLWAFSRMGFARLMMPRVSGLKFWKLMGTGAGDGFSTKPNFGVYTILCVWDDQQSARDAFTSKQPFKGNAKRSNDHVHLTLSPTQARGDWAGGHPFGNDVFDTPDGPVVALTRATIRLRHLRQFWQRVPAISDAIQDETSRHFMMGMGEVPWLHQVTFSIWSNGDAMRAFSLTSPTHGEAVRQAYQKGWFKDQLFARFNLIGIEGHWPELDKLPFLAHLKTTP
jgi:spheroidene monooxygenase